MEPKKHHFLPESYLARWGNAKGVLQVARNFRGKIKWSELSPAATAREVGLYSYTESFKTDNPADIEVNFFQKLDAGGAEILSKIERNDELSVREIAQWSQYILNLKVRVPDVVSAIRKDAEACFKRYLDEEPGEYARLKPEDAPPTFEGWVEENYPGLIENIGVGQIPKIANKKAIEDLMSFDMYVFNCNSVSYRLLCSDRPLIMTSGLQDPMCTIALPISPTRLVVHARQRSGIIESLKMRGTKVLVKHVNVDVISQARSRVYAQAKSHAPDSLLVGRLSDSAET